MSTFETFAPRYGSAPARGRPSAARDGFARIFAALLSWQRRYAERRHLADLDDHLLKDIGLTREQIACEAAKPVWRERAGRP